jgi:hypothetical protein
MGMLAGAGGVAVMTLGEKIERAARALARRALRGYGGRHSGSRRAALLCV